MFQGLADRPRSAKGVDLALTYMGLYVRPGLPGKHCNPDFGNDQIIFEWSLHTLQNDQHHETRVKAYYVTFEPKLWVKAYDLTSEPMAIQPQNVVTLITYASNNFH